MIEGKGVQNTALRNLNNLIKTSFSIRKYLENGKSSLSSLLDLFKLGLIVEEVRCLGGQKLFHRNFFLPFI